MRDIQPPKAAPALASEFSLPRFEAFSDGVFAIAITLLVIEIHVPELGGLTHWRAVMAIGELWPQFVSYAASFVVIGIVWVNHHSLFHFVRRVNREILLWNLLCLMTIAFVPFATALLGDHPDSPVASVFYGLSMLGVSIAYNLLGAAVSRCYIRPLGLLPPEKIKRGTLRNRFSIVAYSIATAVAWNWPYIALILYCVIALVYLLPSDLDFEHEARRREAGNEQ